VEAHQRDRFVFSLTGFMVVGRKPIT
jgi:hypothetical protein